MHGTRLRILRVAAGLTMAQACSQAAISIGYLSLVESTKRTPSAPVLVRMAAAYGLSAGVLLTIACPTVPVQLTDTDTRILALVDEILAAETKLAELLV